MPRIDDLLFQEEVVKLEQDTLLHLIDIDIPAAPTIRLVDSNSAVTFNTLPYIAFPFQFSGGFTQSSDGSIDKATLSLANPERFMMPYLSQAGGLKGTRVTVYTIYASMVTQDPPPYIVDYFEVDSYTANDTVVNLMLDPAVDLNVKLPKGQFNTNSCRFRYKDPFTCKYAGDLKYCKKTLQDCKLHTVPFFSTGKVFKGTDIYNNSVFWGPNFPINTKPGYVIVIAGVSYTIKSAGVTAKLQSGTIVTNTLVVSGATIADNLAGLDYQILKGNQRNYGGYPGVPSTVRRLVL